DQAVLEHERAQFGAGLAMLDDCRVRGPAGALGAGLEVRARPGAQRDRLADVEGTAAAVAKHVHAGRVGQLREVQAPRQRPVPGEATGRWTAATAATTTGGQQRRRLA